MLRDEQMGHAKGQEGGHNEGCAACSKLNILNAWLYLQTPDFPVKVNVEITINFHKAEFYCACVTQFPGD